VALAATFLGVVSAVVLFPSLGLPAMEPDESLYALATDQIRASGQWWTLSPQPPSPYFNKPPLYMWLSAITYDWLPGFEFRYRFWSAVFGCLAVVMTGLLGARLFNGSVGLVAGLLLLTNRSFLTDHGARFGGMDAGLTACFATILWLYCRGVIQTFGPPGQSPGRRPAARWVMIGVVAGIASLLKPLGGLPILAAIALHAMLVRRTAARHYLPAVTLVLATALAVAGPWYLINHLRYPGEFATFLFGRQIADAVAGGEEPAAGRAWWYYLAAVTGSSTHFALVLPAAAWMLWRACIAGPHQSAALLLSIAGLGWIAALSLAQKKFLHYAYPGFVALAIAFAAALAALAGSLHNKPSATPRASAVVMPLIIAGLFGFALWLAVERLPKMSDSSPIWTLYRQWQPDLHAGRARMLFWNVPHERGQLMPDGRPPRPHMLIYLSHIRPAAATTTGEDLTTALRSDVSTLLILPAGEAPPTPAGRPPPAVLLQERWFTVVRYNANPPATVAVRP